MPLAPPAPVEQLIEQVVIAEEALASARHIATLTHACSHCAVLLLELDPHPWIATNSPAAKIDMAIDCNLVFSITRTLLVEVEPSGPYHALPDGRNFDGV